MSLPHVHSKNTEKGHLSSFRTPEVDWRTTTVLTPRTAGRAIDMKTAQCTGSAETVKKGSTYVKSLEIERVNAKPKGSPHVLVATPTCEISGLRSYKADQVSAIKCWQPEMGSRGSTEHLYLVNLGKGKALASPHSHSEILI